MQRASILLLALLLLALGVWVWSRSGTLTPVVPVRDPTGPIADQEVLLIAPPGGPGEGQADAAPGRFTVGPADRPLEEAPLRGRLIDDQTGEPVPWYELGVSMRGERVCRVETDAEGRFETPVAYPAGTLTLSLDDVEGQESSNKSTDLIAQLDHDPAAPEQEVPIGVGPTYYVALELSTGLEPSDLRVRLYLDPPEHRNSERNFFGSGHDRNKTVLRPAPHGSDVRWVRFRKSRLPSWRAWLSVDSLDGMWRGGARVDGGGGIHPEVAEIELRPRCAVRGRFVATTPPVRGGAQIALFRDGESARPLLWEHASAEGGFRIADLDPDAYRIEVRDEAVRAAPVRFMLSDGELDLGGLAWEPIPLAGSVRLHLRSTLEVPIDVQLVRSLDPPRYPLWHSDDWQELPGGGFESLFEWEEVYAGEYAIEVHGHGELDWHLPLGQLVPPVVDLVLELPVPAEPLRFEVSAQDGGEVDSWDLWVRGEGIREPGGPVWQQVDPADGRFTSPVIEQGLRWAVWSPGRRAQSAGLGNATWPGSGERTIYVSLRTGWSRLFVVRNRAGWDVVAGAEVWLDGAPAGTTDARGELMVERDTTPVDWEVRHPTLVWVEAGPKSGEEGLDGFVVYATLRPR